MKKIFAILLAGMMTATAFAGCNGEQASTQNSGSSSKTDTSAMKVTGSIVDEAYFGDEDNIKLKVWAPDAAIELVKSQVEDFKKAYKNKTFDIEIVAQGENDAASQILIDPTIAADIFAFPSDQLDKLIPNLLPVAFADQVKSMNSEETVKVVTAKNAEGADTIYAYPETNDNGYYLVYDNTVVTAEDAKTLEGTLEACKKAGKKFIMDAANGYYTCTFAFTAGVIVDGYEEDGKTQKLVDYDEDEAVKTLMAISKLIREYKGTFVSLDISNISSGFDSNTCGAGIDGTWDTASNQKALGDKFGAAPLPTINVEGKAKQLISVLGYKYIGVNANTSFPRAAQILAYYLHGEECQLQRAEQLGWGPSNKDVQQNKVVTESAALSAIAEQAKTAVPQVNINTKFWEAMNNLGNKLVSDQWNPDDEEATRLLLKETVKNACDKG